MQKKLTITVHEDVYADLHRVIGRRRISRFLEYLARPYVVKKDLEATYRAMAADEPWWATSSRIPGPEMR